MEMLCSLKSYYEENKLSRILVNVFFFIIILIYLFPFWGFKVFGFNTEEVIFDYLFKIFQFDFVVTGALTVIFIMMYSYLMSNSIIIKAIYTIIFVLNLWYSIMGIGMFSNPFSYKDFLALLPQIILLIIFGLINIKFKKYKCVEGHKVNGLTIFLSVIIPLFLINILGRLIFHFIA